MAPPCHPSSTIVTCGRHPGSSVAPASSTFASRLIAARAARHLTRSAVARRARLVRHGARRPALEDIRDSRRRRLFPCCHCQRYRLPTGRRRRRRRRRVHVHYRNVVCCLLDETRTACKQQASQLLLLFAQFYTTWLESTESLLYDSTKRKVMENSTIPVLRVGVSSRTFYEASSLMPDETDCGDRRARIVNNVIVTRS